MSLSKEAQAILDAVEKLSVLDLSELVSAMEEKFNVSAAAPVAVAAAPAGVAAVAEEKSEFTVVLKDAGTNKIAVIKLVREVTGLGLAEAKALSEKGGELKAGVKPDEAKDIEAKFKEAGAKVELS